MSKDIDQMCFADLIQKGRIRIPQIQRDYAQGRQHKEVNEIRDHFVRTLMLVVCGKKSGSQLDFIYGSDRNDAFEPLDGQQRLTTLFLLYWVLGFDLKTSTGESKLIYETRNTSENFCKELVRHVAKQFVDEANQKSGIAKKAAELEKEKPEAERDRSKLQPHEYTPSEIIRNRDWFQWGWRFDPTISSMLVMIDTICKHMDWSLKLSDCRERLCNITFNHLDLGELGMSDELFIKMNARGKLLSDFDKIKSTIEEEIQLQQTEKDCNGKLLATLATEHAWREHMDGKWIDLFWQLYAKQTMSVPPTEDNKATRLHAAQEAEKRFKVFVLRLMAMQIFTKIPVAKGHADTKGASIQSDAERRDYDQMQKYIENLYEASYNINEAELDNLLIAYQNQLVDWRSNNNETQPDFCTVVNFDELISDLDHWIIDDGNGLYKDVTTVLPKDSYFDDIDSTYFARLVDDNISNDVTATLFAMLCFLRRYPYKNINEWIVNFEEWTRLFRNVFKFDNNTDRINKRIDLADAFNACCKISVDLCQYIESTETDVYNNDDTVLQFLKETTYTYKGIDNKSLEEERLKATLRLSLEEGAGWTKAIREAEANPYLWGQIRCLLYWSNKDLKKFKEYSDCLTKWINLDRQWGKQEKYYNAILCLLPDCWTEKNRLYEFNRDRDNSMKRYLRDDPDYGKMVRIFVETWLDWNANAGFEEYCRHIINDTENSGWVRYFKQQPKMIWECWRKRLFMSKGHVIFAQQKTTDSHCFDPIFLYIRSIAQSIEGLTVEFNDSKSLGSHEVIISTPVHSCDVRWGEGDGEYIITKDGTDEVTTDIENLINCIQSVMADYKAELEDSIPTNN